MLEQLLPFKHLPLPLPLPLPLSLPLPLPLGLCLRLFPPRPLPFCLLRLHPPALRLHLQFLLPSTRGLFVLLPPLLLLFHQTLPLERRCSLSLPLLLLPLTVCLCLCLCLPLSLQLPLRRLFPLPLLLLQPLTLHLLPHRLLLALLVLLKRSLFFCKRRAYGLLMLLLLLLLLLLVQDAQSVLPLLLLLLLLLLLMAKLVLLPLQLSHALLLLLQSNQARLLSLHLLCHLAACDGRRFHCRGIIARPQFPTTSPALIFMSLCACSGSARLHRRCGGLIARPPVLGIRGRLIIREAQGVGQLVGYTLLIELPMHVLGPPLVLHLFLLLLAPLLPHRLHFRHTGLRVCNTGWRRVSSCTAAPRCWRRGRRLFSGIGHHATRRKFVLPRLRLVHAQSRFFLAQHLLTLFVRGLLLLVHLLEHRQFGLRLASHAGLGLLLVPADFCEYLLVRFLQVSQRLLG